ncbi:Protein CBG00277 [Caenorhabditis briggsae]|uniref:Protein CBG00277 n=2 Tax=Caenorhabditis briggsae TaxID=6238 RepID=A8WML5_CAEBR|nr:Protein CBG00277 [Caenorhabditis briggsae]CAP21720.2 Protein CBG00277 [Caenorhabditis briggsae]
MSAELVPNERECPECLNGKMSLVKDNALPLHFVWRCSSCKTSNIITKKMIRENTFFQEQKLSVQKIVHIAADWVESPGRNNERTASLHGVTTSTIVNLNKLFRQLTEQWFERQIEKNSNFLLGGPGKIVEIDESHMYKAKYNRGHMLRRKSIWIFGMTERHTNKVAMFRVKQRDAATLLPIIRAHVKPGSMIVSDGWAAYGGIRTLQRAFTHRWVNHKVNFVDPSDRRVHTQSIEATWGAFKRELKAKYGVPEDQLDGYMSTYMFRRYFGRKKLLNHLLIEMKYYKKEYDYDSSESEISTDEALITTAVKTSPIPATRIMETTMMKTEQIVQKRKQFDSDRVSFAPKQRNERNNRAFTFSTRQTTMAARLNRNRNERRSSSTASTMRTTTSSKPEMIIKTNRPISSTTPRQTTTKTRKPRKKTQSRKADPTTTITTTATMRTTTTMRTRRTTSHQSRRTTTEPRTKRTTSAPETRQTTITTQKTRNDRRRRGRPTTTTPRSTTITPRFTTTTLKSTFTGRRKFKGRG